jgi:hypothetical protein
VATFDELREQAEQEAGPPLVSGDTDFVEQAAYLLAALRLWAETQQRTEPDVQEVVATKNATLLTHLATELTGSGSNDDALEASRRLEAIGYAPSDRVSEIFDFAHKGHRSSCATPEAIQSRRHTVVHAPSDGEDQEPGPGLSAVRATCAASPFRTFFFHQSSWHACDNVAVSTCTRGGGA